MAEGADAVSKGEYSFCFDPPQRHKGDVGHLAVFYTVDNLIYVIQQVNYLAEIAERDRYKKALNEIRANHFNTRAGKIAHKVLKDSP